jgi:hypothetical protein
MSRPLLTDELRTILARQAAAGVRGAARALARARAQADLWARTGCRDGCAERGVSTYCATHYRPEEEPWIR